MPLKVSHLATHNSRSHWACHGKSHISLWWSSSPLFVRIRKGRTQRHGRKISGLSEMRSQHTGVCRGCGLCLDRGSSKDDRESSPQSLALYIQLLISASLTTAQSHCVPSRTGPPGTEHGNHGKSAPAGLPWESEGMERIFAMKCGRAVAIQQLWVLKICPQKGCDPEG